MGGSYVDVTEHSSAIYPGCIILTVWRHHKNLTRATPPAPRRPGDVCRCGEIIGHRGLHRSSGVEEEPPADAAASQGDDDGSRLGGFLYTRQIIVEIGTRLSFSAGRSTYGI